MIQLLPSVARVSKGGKVIVYKILPSAGVKYSKPLLRGHPFTKRSLIKVRHLAAPYLLNFFSRLHSFFDLTVNLH